MIEALIKFGADVNAKNSKGATAFIFAAGFNSDLDVVKTLISAGSDINAENNRGETALMVAIQVAQFKINPEVVNEVVKNLISAGADIFAKDNEGKTAFDYAKTDEMKHILLDAAK